MAAKLTFALLFGAGLMLQIPTPGLYNAEPEHISNRLYNTLFVRQFGGHDFGYDELDPLLWRESKYLLVAPGYQRAISVLDEFLKDEAPPISDPLRRAVLQHDLWAIFDWIAEDSNYSDERAVLAGKLAQAIRRLALTSDQIRSLPNTYADAAASKVFRGRYDPDNPQTPFLPLDLFAPDGSWVELTALGGGLVAGSHAATFRERSVFRVFMRLADDRQVTLQYLKRLRDFPNFLQMVSRPDNHERIPQFELSPNVPQFPLGTTLALVRQMTVIDDHGNLVPTKIIEDVQLRVYRGIGGAMSVDSNPRAAKQFQDFFEFKMKRAHLFASETGGLQAVTPNETELPVFASHGIDMIEDAGSFFPVTVLDSCGSCHFRPGIHSVLSIGQKKLIPATGDEAATTISRKRSSYSWGLLTGLWAK